MASYEKMIAEITLDDEDEEMDFSNTSKFNGTSSFHIENDDFQLTNDELDLDISRINEPVESIFAVEQDDGVECDTPNQPEKNKPIRNATPFKPSLRNPITTKQVDSAIRTRRSSRVQSIHEKGNSNVTSTPTVTALRDKRKVATNTPEIVASPPVKLLRSAIRETRNDPNAQNKVNLSASKSGPKKSTPINQPSNKPAAQPTHSEPKSAKKSSLVNGNNNQITNGSASKVRKNSGFSNNNKSSTLNNNKSQVNLKQSQSTNGKQNGSTAARVSKMPKILPTETQASNANANASENGNVTIKKRSKAYWKGKEHLKLLGPDSPFVMLEKLDPFLSGQTEYKGHDCLTTKCSAKLKSKTPIPPPRIAPLKSNLSATIDEVASDVPPSPVKIAPGMPQLGNKVRFQLWITPMGNNIPAKSSPFEATIIGYDEELDLYTIKLFHYDHPFVVMADKSKNQRITTNIMVIQWESLAERTIVDV